MTDKNSFDYTYSAKQQKELVSILYKYEIDAKELSSQDISLEELRKLDKSSSRTGVIAGLTVAVIGTLVMGTGMSMVLVQSSRLFVQGVGIGIAGIIMVIFAYPIYRRITKKEKEKNTPKIKELADKKMSKEV